MGEKRVLGYVWCILRVQFRQALIFGCYEHTQSPYGRYGTRRLLRYNKFVDSCVRISAAKTLCVRNLRGSTDSPESCRGRCPHRPTQIVPFLRKSTANSQFPRGPMWASAPTAGASEIYASSGSTTLSAARSGVTVCVRKASMSESVMLSSRSKSQKQSWPANMASHIR